MKFRIFCSRNNNSCVDVCRNNMLLQRRLGISGTISSHTGDRTLPVLLACYLSFFIGIISCFKSHTISDDKASAKTGVDAGRKSALEEFIIFHDRKNPGASCGDDAYSRWPFGNIGGVGPSDVFILSLPKMTRFCSCFFLFRLLRLMPLPAVEMLCHRRNKIPQSYGYGKCLQKANRGLL